jgi:hypothetical protein
MSMLWKVPCAIIGTGIFVYIAIGLVLMAYYLIFGVFDLVRHYWRNW